MCASATRVGWTAKSQFQKVEEDPNTTKSGSAGKEVEGVARGNGAGLDMYL
jgi:hypothetical protein